MLVGADRWRYFENSLLGCNVAMPTLAQRHKMVASPNIPKMSRRLGRGVGVYCTYLKNQNTMIDNLAQGPSPERSHDDSESRSTDQTTWGGRPSLLTKGVLYRLTLEHTIMYKQRQCTRSHHRPCGSMGDPLNI